MKKRLRSLPEDLHFSSEVEWLENKIGWLKTGNHSDRIAYGCPLGFGGEEGRVTPEGLFLSSVTTCTLSTILHLADRMHFCPSKLLVRGEAVIEKGKGREYSFRSIICKIDISGETDEFLMKRLCSLAPEHCLIKQVIKPEVQYEFTINGQEYKP